MKVYYDKDADLAIIQSKKVAVIAVSYTHLPLPTKA